MNEIESPCIKICKQDINGVCMGCLRTKNEIGDWSTYTNEQKQEVLDKASKRSIVEEETRGFSF